MITGKSEELAEYVKTHCCPEHPDKELVVAWNRDQGYIIRCGAGHYPEEIVNKLSRTRQYKTGELWKVDPEFSLLPTKDLETGQALSAAQIRSLIVYAEKYGLDPYRGHVVMMFGNPYIGLDGYLYHAKQAGIAYTLKSRPLGPQERTDYQVEEGDHAWTANLNINYGYQYFVGLGIVKASELTEQSKKTPDRLRYPVVAAHPWQLAQKRAEWQAMRRGFPIGESPEKKEGEHGDTTDSSRDR